MKSGRKIGFGGWLAGLLLAFASGVLRAGENASDPERIVVRGVVVDERARPVPGASVTERDRKGNGATTDRVGRFRLSLPEQALVRVSFLGFHPVEFPAQQLPDTIVLTEESFVLGEVVVTALGIKRRKDPLVYAMDWIDGSELRRAVDPNLIVGMAGKVSGVEIEKNASGLGGSARIRLRGTRSAAGENQPLFVIDGMPMLNGSPEQAYSAIGGVADAGNRDGGDGISNLNVDDIESISILKGAPAAALYGSQAANGVILITTKRGEQGRFKANFATHLTIDRAFELPEFQNRYGVSDELESWGERRSMRPVDQASDFFRTGVTSITSVALSGGTERLQTYFSYGNTTGRGVVPNNGLSRHTFNLRESAAFFGERLRLDGNVTLVRQQVKDRPVPGGFYMNPLVGLYRFPRGEELSGYRESFEVYDASRRLYVQNWHAPHEDFEQNPYWVVNRIRSNDVRSRAMLALTADVQVTGWLKVRARGNADFISDRVRQKFYASTATALAGLNGRYIEAQYEELLVNGELLAMVDRKWNDFSLRATVGTGINDRTVNSLRYDSKTASLRYANVFNVANIVMDGSAYLEQRIDARRQVQSLFATAEAGYRESLFLELTGRNDWASTLAYTAHEVSGFFYPSVGISWVMNRMLRFPEWISFGKVRAAWSRVGNDIPLFVTNPVSHISAGGEIQAADAAPFKEMEPEMTSSVEAGTEWRFFDDRLSLNLTYYQTHTRNQFFKLPAQTSDAYAFRYVNAGDIRNEGVEIAAGGYPVKSFPLKGLRFSWKSDVTFSLNRNRVVRLHDELPEFVYGPSSLSSTYAMKLMKGGSVGDIYGKAFVRDGLGQIVYETEGSNRGLPRVTGDGNTVKVGNANPLFRLGWNNLLSLGPVTLTFLIDCRYGGDVLSQTMADMDAYGVTARTARDRDRGYVLLEGRRIENVKGFYKLAGGRAGVTEYYMYDATNVRLRELTVAFDFPERWLGSGRVLKGAQVALVGRNLFFFYKAAPFDPELVLSTGNDNQGIDVYGMPTTRSFGLDVRLEF